MKFFNYTLFALSVLSCGQTTKKTALHSTVSNYYDTYKERKDFDAFLEFYDENIILEDVISGDRKKGKKAFAEFFDWNHPSFRPLDSIALIIEKQIIDGREVVTQGYFTPFKWDSIQVGHMHFTTILTFNLKGKIIRQVDWINYPANLIDYQKRDDSNSWIDNQ